MFQPVSLFIAWRYGRARNSSAFTRFINRFALGGIALGLMALIIVMSVMNGFEAELKQRILGAVPHLTLQQDDPISDWRKQRQQLPAIANRQAVLPLVQGETLIQANGEMVVAMARGRVTPLREDEKVLPQALTDALRVGSWESLQEGRYQLIIGQGVANRLGVTIGDNVRVISASGAVYTPFGMVPSQRRFQISGVFALQSEVDNALVVSNATDLGRLMRRSGSPVDGFQIQLQDAFLAPQASQRLTRQTHYQVSDWRSQYGQLFDAVAMEKRMMWLMLALIIAVAAFNTLSALVMVINEKRHDIAILQTLGLSQPQLRRVFLLQGSYNGVVGTLMGLGLGLLISYFINPLLSALGVNLLAISPAGLPVVVDVTQVLAVAIFSLLLCLAATVYPALIAARTQPSEALRYD